MEKLGDKLFNWASILEDNTREQAIRTASMPFIFPHVALMPDAHLGMGSTVGSVVPTEGAIMPACVGVDIGCGMKAVRTQFTVSDFGGMRLSVLREMIERAVPSSAGGYNTGVYAGYTVAKIKAMEAEKSVESAENIAPNWRLQLGSLGGGNHFIELSADEQGRVWAFLHSGSRGVGNKLAQKHIKIAQNLNRKWKIQLPHPDLAYLVEDTDEFWAYIRDLQWAQKFAALNRDEMMDRVLGCLSAFMGMEPVRYLEEIQCHHNYTSLEHHFGRQVWLTRKGAIDAWDGVRGLIPGSMGDKSYVVTGKGNKLALCTAPHGAGRVHSRASARRAFTMEQLEASMKGIEWRHDVAFLDEIPAAYKEIDTVMADAADLVQIDHTLRQLINVKGQ